jgi:hypothetical protein
MTKRLKKKIKTIVNNAALQHHSTLNQQRINSNVYPFFMTIFVMDLWNIKNEKQPLYY